MASSVNSDGEHQSSESGSEKTPRTPRGPKKSKNSARQKHSAPSNKDGYVYQSQSGGGSEKVKPHPNMLSLTVSETLMAKIRSQAEDEGISIEDLVLEFLAESVTLRAWEILEKKAQMRSGGTSGNSNSNNNRASQGGGNRRKGGGRGGMNHARYNSIMDGQANFLEYVRTQERNRR